MSANHGTADESDAPEEYASERVSEQVEAIWLAHYGYLLDAAYRLLGSFSEAQDVVQEAFIRLLRTDIADIRDPRGWLFVVVSRLCMDRLRNVRRELYVGPWLPEPLVPNGDPDADPADRVTLDETVRMALLIVLEQLSPAERVAFVLHDVFDVPFEVIASIVGRSPAASRQLASRARARVRQAEPPRFVIDPAEHRRVSERFVTACQQGDLRGLAEILHPEVTLSADGGGVGPAARRPIIGHSRVLRLLRGLIRKYPDVSLVPTTVNAGPGFIAWQDGRLLAVGALSVRDGRVAQVLAVTNPGKLMHAAKTLSAPGHARADSPPGGPGSPGRMP